MTNLKTGPRTKSGPRLPLGAWLVGGIVAGSLLAIGVLALVRVVIDSGGPPQAMPSPQFIEEAISAGVDHVYDGEFTFFVGGGVAVFDCNADQLPDLYLAGGVNPAALYSNQSPVGGKLRFDQVSSPVTDLTSVTGAYPLDVDGDGIVDLAVLRFGENVMLHGLGDCRFEPANEIWGVDGGNEWTTAFSAQWEGQAPLPTLAFGTYVKLSDTGERQGCSDSVMFRPEETATYGAPIPLSPGWCTLSILFSDWDRSGRRDLRMTNDRHYYRDGEEQLWRVGEGEPPRLYTEEEGWQTMKIWGMAIASHDLTGDGLPEVFLTSQGDNKLQTLVDGATEPNYVDIALDRGANAHRPFAGADTVLPSTAWHAEFQDVNNDTFVDLFIAKGNVEAMPEFASDDPSNLLLGNPDGTFTESAEAAGIVNFDRGRGAALADFNLDGLLDLVEVNRRENIKLWRNVGSGEADQSAPMGGWIALQLEQPGPNRDAIGSWIEVRTGNRTMERELTVGGGHAGGQLGWIHFGLGTEDEAEIRVQWPDGEKGPWMTVDANQFVMIERGKSEAHPWLPPQS
ncbi:MAG TPA: CRTAC1 family protein [Acidimicrobiia bacterium]|nr:CRTAC1 family protein [Acidimicrobiia bacterium]